MIRTLSDLLRHYGDQAITHGPTASGDGKRTTITFEIDHPAECLACEGHGQVLRWGHSSKGHIVTPCPLCHGSGLAVEMGGEG